MHGIKTPTLFGLRTSSRPASPAPKTSPPHVPPLVPTGAITPLDLSTPASPIEGPKDIPLRRPLARLYLPSAFRRPSPSPAPPITTPSPATGSNYLDALALRISEAAGKAIAPPPSHNSDGLLLHGRRPLPPGRGKLLGQVIQSEILTAQQGGQDLLRASLRALHRPLNVLLTNVSTLLAPLVVTAPTHVLSGTGTGWVQLGASQAHALSLATLVAELLESLDALPTDCAKVGGEGLRSIKQGLEGVISRVVQPVLNAIRTELVALVDQLEFSPLGKKETPLSAAMTLANKVLARIASVPGPVAGGAMAACEIAVVWRAMVALSHRNLATIKSLTTKSSGPLKSSPPNKPTPLSKSTSTKRLTPPNTPPPTRFLLPTSRPPSPTPVSPAAQLANDAKVVCGLLDGMPRPSGEDAKEAVGEAVGAFARFVEMLGVLATPGFDTTQLVRLVDGQLPLPAPSGANKSPSSVTKSPSSATKSPSSTASDDQDELPALIVLPTLLHGRSVASILGIDEAAYRERCLSGFGRAEASEQVVVRAVLARLDELDQGDKVDEWVKVWLRDRAED